jgi:hypothetical protein
MKDTDGVQAHHHSPFVGGLSTRIRRIRNTSSFLRDGLKLKKSAYMNGSSLSSSAYRNYRHRVGKSAHEIAGGLLINATGSR